jgi:hypothetical protein
MQWRDDTTPCWLGLPANSCPEHSMRECEPVHTLMRSAGLVSQRESDLVLPSWPGSYNSTEDCKVLHEEDRKFPDYSHQEDRPGGLTDRSASADNHTHPQNRSASSRARNCLLLCAVVEVACHRCIVESTEDINPRDTRAGPPRGPTNPTVRGSKPYLSRSRTTTELV